MKKIPNQKLLTIQDDEGGKAVIKRGTDGEGYYLHGEDNEFGIIFGYLPLTQEQVAREFKAKGKEWKREEAEGIFA